LAIDKLGRLWVGHLNSGVSVYNGKDWKNYDVVDGPIGERIFDIKICPKDGDVWMATSAGISRYKINKDEWEHFTRENGLPEDQASVLAFKNDGTLIVGTQCYGLAIFNRIANGNYKFYQKIDAPERFGPGNCSPVPLEPREPLDRRHPLNGRLLSNLINDIIVTKNTDKETIYVATNAGFVKMNDQFKGLSFWRGRDYADKVRGLYGGAPKGWQQAPKEIMDQLLPEDYLTCLAEDEQGVIWLGTRQNGTMLADAISGKKSYGTIKAMGYPDNFVTKILCLSGGEYLVGFYGGGVVKSIKPFRLVDRKLEKTRFNIAPTFSVTKKDFPKLPSPIKPLTAEELRAMYYKLKKIHHQSKPPKVLALNDDWRTQGDWIDRYGRHSAVQCAMAGGGDFFGGYFLHEMESCAWIGKNYRQKNDQIRRWIHWFTSNDKRVLQCLWSGGRMQAEWDDHKEAYPMSLDGPHIYSMYKVPQGKYILSFYFFNKDGHDGANRLRDCVISVKTMKLSNELFEKLGNKGIDAEREFINARSNITTRVNNFWGGVYKRFLIDVEKNEYITVQINANYSFNTIVSGVFFDPVGKLKSLNYDTQSHQLRQPSKWVTILNDVSADSWWRVNILDQSLCLRDNNSAWFYTKGRKYILPITRSLVEIKEGVPRSPVVIDKKDKEIIRSDVGSLLRELQLFEIADKVDFTSTKYELYGWEGRTALRRDKVHTYKWNWEKFY
jgi:hypothetical protein